MASGDNKAGKKSKGSGCLDMLISVGVLVIAMVVYLLGYDLWSRFYIAPQLSSAEAAAKGEHFTEALGYALPILRKHPDNPRLLYFVCRTYWILDQRPLAAFYARAYLRSAHLRDSEQSKNLGQLLAADSLMWPYFKDFPDSWAFLGLSPEAKAALSLEVKNSPSEFVENWKLYDKLPRGWAKSNTVMPAALLTEPSDVAEGNRAGFVNLGASALCNMPDDFRTTGRRPVRWCSPIFQSGKLSKAVNTGRLTINYPEGGDGCCTLSLDDPDLRPLGEVVAAFVARRKAAGRGDPDASAEGIGSLMDLRQRVILKQSFLLNFASYAPRD